MNKSQLQVEAIHNGTVIDHIPAGQGIKILQLFGLAQTHEKITVGLNLPSKALGAKDIIKVGVKLPCSGLGWTGSTQSQRPYSLFKS